MESLEHWGLFFINQVDKNTFIETILYGRSSTELSTFNTKTESFSDIAIDNFIKKNINMTLLKRHSRLRKLKLFIW
jgi:hypothetical protein